MRPTSTPIRSPSSGGGSRRPTPKWGWPRRWRWPRSTIVADPPADGAPEGLGRPGLRVPHQLREPKGPRAGRKTIRAALLFYWDAFGRQIRIEGTVEPVSAEESDAYFDTRPLGAQIGAHASQQSRPTDSREALDRRVQELTREFKASPYLDRRGGAGIACGLTISSSGRTGTTDCTTGCATCRAGAPGASTASSPEPRSGSCDHGHLTAQVVPSRPARQDRHVKIGTSRSGTAASSGLPAADGLGHRSGGLHQALAQPRYLLSRHGGR